MDKLGSAQFPRKKAKGIISGQTMVTTFNDCPEHLQNAISITSNSVGIKRLIVRLAWQSLHPPEVNKWQTLTNGRSEVSSWKKNGGKMVVSMLNVHHNMNKSGVPDRSIGQIRGSRSCHPDLHQPRNNFFVCCWRWKALTKLVTLVPLARECPRREEKRTCVKQCSSILGLISSIQIDGTNLSIKLFIHFVEHVEKLSSIQDLTEGEMQILRTQIHIATALGDPWPIHIRRIIYHL